MPEKTTRNLGERRVVARYNGYSQPDWQVIEMLEVEYTECKKLYQNMPDAEKRMTWSSRVLPLCTLETPAE